VTAVLLTIETHVEVKGFRYERLAELLAVKPDPLIAINPPPGPAVGETTISPVTNVYLTER